METEENVDVSAVEEIFDFFEGWQEGGGRLDSSSESSGK